MNSRKMQSYNLVTNLGQYKARKYREQWLEQSVGRNDRDIFPSTRKHCIIKMIEEFELQCRYSIPALNAWAARA